MGHIFRFILACPLVIALTIVGCRKDRDAGAQARADREAMEFQKRSTWDAEPTVIKPEPVAVVQGRTPLVHLFDVGGPIRVVDMTTKSPVASATVPDRTLVRIDDRNGVTIGKQNLVPGPLPVGHVYVIYLDPATPSEFRQSVGPAQAFQPQP